jgi:hypothetical protein
MSAATQGRRERVRGGRRVVRKVRLTVEEDVRLVRLAAVQRVTVPRLLAESALAADGWTITQRRELVEECFAARRQLAGVARNVNQIARWSNAQRVARDAETLVAMVERAIGRLDAAVEGLRP